LQIGGAILFVLGIWTLVDKNFLSELLGTNLFSGAVYVMIGTSALVCLLSFFGCMGASKEIKCMLLSV
jgi:tetraspanin-11